MSDYDLIRKIWDTGHFFSPEALDVDLVVEADLPKLTLSDAVVKGALESYERWFHDDAEAIKRRRGIVPADLPRELLSLPRCGMPDYAHPSEAREEANWPESCRNQITTSYRMTLNPFSASQLEAIWKEADGNWEKALEVGFIFQPQNYPNTRIFAFAATLGGNVLADQYLAQNNCNVRLQGRFDTRTWSPELLVTTTTHEHGHALGLQHLQNSQATMFPSITPASMSRRGAPHQSDLVAAVQLGYRLRTTPPPNPPTPPTDGFVRLPDKGTYQIIELIDGKLALKFNP